MGKSRRSTLSGKATVEMAGGKVEDDGSNNNQVAAGVLLLGVCYESFRRKASG